MAKTSFLEDALALLGKSWKQEGKVLTPEISGRLTEIVKPLAVPAKSYTKEVNQGRLLNSLLYSTDPHLADPRLVKSFAKGVDIIPDRYYETFKPEMRFSKNIEELRDSQQGAGFATFGQYNYRKPDLTAGSVPQNPDVALNQYIDVNRNPKVVLSHSISTPAHEGLHVGTFAGKDTIKSSSFKDSNDVVADVRGTSNLVRAMKPDMIAKLAAHGFNPYDIIPDETAANIFGSRLTAGEKDIEGLFKYSHEKAMEDFRNFLPLWEKKGKEWGDRYRGVALPLALGAGALGADAAIPEESQAGPVNIKNIWRGSKSVGKELTMDNIMREIYNLKPRASYRTIDNPVGASQFGDVFPVELNMRNLFDARQEPEKLFEVAKIAYDRHGYDPVQTVRKMLTGNWDAYERGENNRSLILGPYQKILQELGYSGNWQVEPTHLQQEHGDLGNALKDFVTRRSQDVFTTFDKGELAVAPLWKRREEIRPAIINAHDLTIPKYGGGEALPVDEARKDIAPLIDPKVFYNDEPMKFFHPNWKPMLEEFRPDAYQLFPEYENKHMFPPSTEGFSAKVEREKITPIVGATESSSNLPTTPGMKTIAKSSLFKDYNAGVYYLDHGETEHTFTHKGKEMKVPDYLVSKIESTLADYKGVSPGDITYEDIGNAIEEAKQLLPKKGKLPGGELKKSPQSIYDSNLYGDPSSVKATQQPHKEMSNIDIADYNAENELDPSKIEFHLPMSNEPLFDAVKSSYLGKEAETVDGAKIKEGLSKLDGFDPEDQILKDALHSQKLPTWYTPNEGTHGKLLDIALKVYDDPAATEEVKMMVVEKSKSLGKKLTEYGEVKKFVKDKYNIASDDAVANDMTHELLNFKSLSAEDAIKAYAKSGSTISLTDVDKFHPKIATALMNAQYTEPFVHGNATFEESALKLFKDEKDLEYSTKIKNYVDSEYAQYGAAAKVKKMVQLSEIVQMPVKDAVKYYTNDPNHVLTTKDIKKVSPELANSIQEYISSGAAQVDADTTMLGKINKLIGKAVPVETVEGALTYVTKYGPNHVKHLEDMIAKSPHDTEKEELELKLVSAKLKLEDVTNILKKDGGFAFPKAGLLGAAGIAGVAATEGESEASQGKAGATFKPDFTHVFDVKDERDPLTQVVKEKYAPYVAKNVKKIVDVGREVVKASDTTNKVIMGDLPAEGENLKTAHNVVSEIGGWTNPVMAGGQILDEVRNFFMPSLPKAGESGVEPFAKLSEKGVLQ